METENLKVATLSTFVLLIIIVSSYVLLVKNKLKSILWNSDQKQKGHYQKLDFNKI